MWKRSSMRGTAAAPGLANQTRARKPRVERRVIAGSH